MAITGSVSGSSDYSLLAVARPSMLGGAGDINSIQSTVANVIPSYIIGMCGTSILNGVTQSMTEGTSSAPCLQMEGKNSFRFQWALNSGSHYIQVSTKQSRNINENTRPSIYINENPFIGLTSSVEVFAASGSSNWVLIGPVPVTASADGAVWVELRNNSNDYSNNPCYFDNIIGS